MTVAGQTERPKLDANEIWEFLFSRTKDAVPEELTNEILADLAAHINKLWIDPLAAQHRREADDELLRDALRFVSDIDNSHPLTRRLRERLAASPSSPASGVRVNRWGEPGPDVDYARYERVHNLAISEYEQRTPKDYRYSATALRHAVDAAIRSALGEHP